MLDEYVDYRYRKIDAQYHPTEPERHEGMLVYSKDISEYDEKYQRITYSDKPLFKELFELYFSVQKKSPTNHYKQRNTETSNLIQVICINVKNIDWIPYDKAMQEYDSHDCNAFQIIKIFNSVFCCHDLIFLVI